MLVFLSLQEEHKQINTAVSTWYKWMNTFCFGLKLNLLDHKNLIKGEPRYSARGWHNNMNICTIMQTNATTAWKYVPLWEVCSIQFSLERFSDQQFSATFQKEIMYLLLHYIYLTATVGLHPYFAYKHKLLLLKGCIKKTKVCK